MSNNNSNSKPNEPSGSNQTTASTNPAWGSQQQPAGSRFYQPPPGEAHGARQMYSFTPLPIPPNTAWYPNHTLHARSELRVYDQTLPPLPERVGPPNPRRGDTRESWTMAARQRAVPEAVIRLWTTSVIWLEDYAPPAGLARSVPMQQGGPAPPLLPGWLAPLDIHQESFTQWEWRARQAGVSDQDINAWWWWAVNRR